MRPLYRAMARTVVADLPPGGRLLDVGTGPGRLLLAIARLRPDVEAVGIDPSPDMVDRAESHARAAGVGGRVTARVATAEDLPFPDSSFDVVVSSLSAHHWADPARGVVEQARVLRPGGHLWVCDLRRSGPAITQALTTTFGPESPTQARAPGLAGLVLTCHRAAGGSAS